MKKIGVLVCNFASISSDVQKKYGIIEISSNLQWPEMNFLEGDNVFQKMRDALKKGINSVPKTSQPSMGTFKKYFEESLAKNDEIICITISSKISGTYNAALQTRKMFKEDVRGKIHIIDSNSIDVGESLLAIKAVEVSNTCDDVSEIIRIVESYIPKIYFYGMTENPNQMEAGGRISHILAVLLTQMQKIGMRPILHMEDGVVKPANLQMNAKDITEALLKQFEDVNKKSLVNGGKYRIAISHADNLEGAEKLKKLFEDKYPSQIRIDLISMTGIFIGAHVGPGTLMCAILEES